MFEILAYLSEIILNSAKVYSLPKTEKIKKLIAKLCANIFQFLLAEVFNYVPDCT